MKWDSFGATEVKVMIFRCTGSLMRTSELLSLCVEQKFPRCDERRTDGQLGAAWESPVWAVFQLDAADSYSRSVSICIPGQFILSSYLLFLSFQSTLCFLLSGLFPLLPTNLTPSLHLASLNLSLSHPQIHQQSYCTAVLPSPFLSVHSLLEQTYEKIMTLSQRSFHKQHKASDNWSGW